MTTRAGGRGAPGGTSAARRRRLGIVHYSSNGRFIKDFGETGHGPGKLYGPHDNALAESVIGLFKTEVIHRRTCWQRRRDVE